jgi:hypothetical protein
MNRCCACSIGIVSTERPRNDGRCTRHSQGGAERREAPPGVACYPTYDVPLALPALLHPSLNVFCVPAVAGLMPVPPFGRH